MLNDIISNLKNVFGLEKKPLLVPISKAPAKNAAPAPQLTDKQIIDMYHSGRLSQAQAEQMLNTGNAPRVVTAPTQVQAPVQTPTPAVLGDYNKTLPGFMPAGNRSPKISQDIIDNILSASKQYNLNPAILAGLIQHESAGTWDPRIVGPTGDYGLVQINLAQHPDVTLAQAYDPSFAIPFAARYLSNALQKYHDINRAIASYNVGLGGANNQGATASGLGPRGQYYLDNVTRNLSPELRKQLGIKTSY